LTGGKQGYRMPAEWEPHQGTWLSWPKDPDTFPGNILPRVESAYAQIVQELARGEEVHILVNDSKAETRVKRMVRSENVLFHLIRTVDVWVRDYAPTYVLGGGSAVVKWEFNAWGNKYDDLLPDGEAGARVAEESGLTVIRPGVVLEGGSIDVNGEGSLLTTEQCLLNANRNPDLGRPKLEEVLKGTLGVDHFIWLGEGIEGDDTDGHVDDVARFVGPRRVMAAVEPDASDRNHGPLKENVRRLGSATDQDGNQLEVTEVPMPPSIGAPDGRLPASHLNFYIGNSSALVPTFGGESDKVALKAIEEAFPKREAVAIDCRALVYGLGTIHCATQQIPKI